MIKATSPKPSFYGLLMAVICAAMGGPASASDEQGTRRAWFVITGMPEGVENPVKAVSGGMTTEISLGRRSPSQPVRIAVDGGIQLLRGDADAATPSADRVPLVSATVPEAVSDALIVLSPSIQENSNLFEATIIDLADFLTGGFLFLNLTLHEIAVSTNNIELEIDPGEHAIATSPDPSQPVSAPIHYRYFDHATDDWKSLASSTVVFSPTRRELCVFIQENEFNRIRYHGVVLPGLDQPGPTPHP